MDKAKLRIAAFGQRVRQSLWFVPGIMVLGGMLSASLLTGSTRPAPRLPGIDLLLPSTLDGARNVLQVVAGSVITATSVVFSLTVIALQMTAGNYSPRVLRTFLRDPGTQIVLGVFLSSFVYTYIVLQNLRPVKEASLGWAPQGAFWLVPVFVLATLAAFVYFIHHVTQAIRVDTILKDVLDETRDTIRRVYGSGPERRLEAPLDSLVPEGAIAVTAPVSGFLQAVATDQLVKALAEERAKAILRPVVGDHVLEDTVLGWIWCDDDRIEEQAQDRLAEHLRGAVQLGPERTMQQDVAFGIRQLVDVAVRALSPGVNDPNTAVATIGHVSVIYGDLVRRPLGHLVLQDDEGHDRVIVPSPSFEEYVHIACQQISHHGKKDAMIVLRLLRMYADLHAIAPDARKKVIEQRTQRVVADAEDGLVLEEDLEAARQAAGAAAQGKTIPAHFTRAG